MEEKDKIEEVFENLQKWRDLPKYRFEERIDIFISVYLKEILTANIKELQDKKHEIIEIIPQFPIKKELNNQSDNTDYAVFVKDIKDEKIELYLIELKTDKGSINRKQIKYYERVQNKETVEILQEIIQKIKPNSDKKEKYNHLLCLLQKKEITEEKLKGTPKIIYMLPNIDEKKDKQKKLWERIEENKKEKSWEIIYFEDAIKSINENEPIAIGLKKLMQNIIEEK